MCVFKRKLIYHLFIYKRISSPLHKLSIRRTETSTTYKDYKKSVENGGPFHI